MTYFSLALGVVLLFVVLLLAQGGLRQSGGIVLPETPVDTDAAGGEGWQGALNVVQILPETVQPAINTLSRPVSYKRTQTVETFWSGGSGRSVSQVAVNGGYTRIDTALPDGSVCHMLVLGGKAAVWYDDETEYTLFRSDQFSADIAQRMLSYETVRDLEVGRISEASYQDLNGVPCIYVATRGDEDGYSDSYWVSISSGLLVAAERLCAGERIYRFTAGEPDGEAPAEELFLLPDGGVLTPEE